VRLVHVYAVLQSVQRFPYIISLIHTSIKFEIDPGKNVWLPCPTLFGAKQRGQCGVFLFMMVSGLDLLALVHLCPK
jgi:hypothetical protein